MTKEEKKENVIRSELIFLHEQLANMSNISIQIAGAWDALKNQRGVEKYGNLALNIERDRDALIEMLTPDEINVLMKQLARLEAKNSDKKPNT